MGRLKFPFNAIHYLTLMIISSTKRVVHGWKARYIFHSTPYIADY
jgi:hypothetical protein